MKHILLLAVLFVGFTQAQTLDSLKNNLQKQSDRQKIETFLDISELQNIPRDTAIFYLNRALVISKKIKFDTTYPIHFALSVANYFKGDFPNAKKAIKKGFESYKFTEDSITTYGHINMLLGVFSEAESQEDSASYFYQKALDKLEKSNTKKSMEILSSVYSNMATLHLKRGQYKKAIDVYIKSAKLSEDIQNHDNSQVVYSNLANCYKEIEDYQKANVYFDKAFEVATKLKDNRVKASVYIGKGEIAILQSKPKQAIEYFKKAEKILEKTDLKSLSNIVCQNLAETYLETGNVSAATYYSDKAMDGISTFKDEFTKGSVLLTHANILTRKNPVKALLITNKAIDLANKNKYLKIKEKAVKQKINILRKLGRYKEAVSLFEDYVVIKDSILNSEKYKSIADIETKYQTEKKEKENLQLKAEKAKKQLELEKESKQKWIYATGFGASLLSLAVFAFYYRKNKKQKQIIINLQRDLHHRVKNNLAIINSLVEDIKDEFDNEQFHDKLTDLQNRIDSINQVHKQLYQTDDVTNLKLKNYIEKLADNVQNTFGQNNIKVVNEIQDNLNFDVDKSFPIGLIVNEFLTNSFKYAFDKKQKGEIHLKIEDNNHNYRLVLNDNGKGLDKNIDINKTNSFGLTIMRLLAKQLGGTFNFKSKNGVELVVEFPK